MDFLSNLSRKKKSFPQSSKQTNAATAESSPSTELLRPSGDDPLAHFDRSTEINATQETVWQILTSTSKWKSWYADVRDIQPGWVEGAELHWQRGASSTIGAVRELEELSLVDATGTWLTWRISTIGHDRVKVTLIENRRTPLTMEGAFARHQEMLTILGRLRSLIEPETPLRWERQLADGGDTGRACGPVRLGDTLFAVAGNRLHAVSLDGVIKWSFDSGWAENPELPVACKGLVVFPTLTRKVRALDAETGKMRWESYLGGDFQGRPPVSDGERVYLMDYDGHAYALDPVSGTLLWKQPGGLSTPPVIAHARLYATHTGPGVVALDPSTGEALWSAQIREIYTALAVVEGSVYVGTESGLVGVDAETGKTQWGMDFYTGRKSTPTVVGSKIYIRTEGHSLCSIDRESRKLDWRYTASSEQYEVILSEDKPVVADGVVYCELGDSNLHAIDAGSGSPLWSRAVEVLGRRPVMVDGTLYFLDDRRLCALDTQVH